MRQAWHAASVVLTRQSCCCMHRWWACRECNTACCRISDHSIRTKLKQCANSLQESQMQNGVISLNVFAPHAVSQGVSETQPPPRNTVSTSRVTLWPLPCCRQRQQACQTAERRALLGTGDRSERIRTYNFQENRITDHRIGYTVHGIEAIMAGTKLGELISKLRERDQQDRLMEVLVTA